MGPQVIQGQDMAGGRVPWCSFMDMRIQRLKSWLWIYHDSPVDLSKFSDISGSLSPTQDKGHRRPKGVSDSCQLWEPGVLAESGDQWEEEPRCINHAHFPKGLFHAFSDGLGCSLMT